jgi:hypothetical protein
VNVTKKEQLAPTGISPVGTNWQSFVCWKSGEDPMPTGFNSINPTLPSGYGTLPVFVKVTCPLLPNEPLVAAPKLRVLVDTPAARFPTPVPLKTNMRFENVALVNSSSEAEYG